MEETIDLREYFAIIKKRFWIIALLAIISALISGVISFFMLNPVYEAKSTLIVNADKQAETQIVTGDQITVTQKLAVTYGEIIKSRIVLDDVIKIGQKEFESNQREISFKKVKLGVSDKIIKYKFITPWLALNQNNIKKYTAADLIEKEEILKRVLIGNILSFSKGMDYTVDETIKVKLDLNQIDVKFKQKEMLAFIGEFFINFEIPYNFAIGKGISRGFGTVKKI